MRIPKRWLVLLMFALAILGVLITRQYGESWDELKFYKYADLSLQAYTTWPTTGTVPEFGNTYDNYGPAYVMLVALGARALQFVLPWSISDLRHLLYFFTFLAGIWAFYALAKRWLSQIAALGATALFATQPLFWGHAFISPKDIPFLSFFLLSLLFGLRLFDQPRPLSLNGLSPRSKRTTLVLTALWLASVFVLFLGVGLIHGWIDGMVRAAAAGTPNLVSRIASDIHRVEPEVYIQRYFTLFIQARAVFFLLSSFALILLYRKLSPTTFHSLLSIFIPAIFLGIATSMRILGPLAGLLVALYAFRKYGVKGHSHAHHLCGYRSGRHVRYLAVFVAGPGRAFRREPASHVAVSLAGTGALQWHAICLDRYSSFVLACAVGHPVDGAGLDIVYCRFSGSNLRLCQEAGIRRIVGVDSRLVRPAAGGIHRLAHALVR